jgi:hypothetical protein
MARLEEQIVAAGQGLARGMATWLELVGQYDARGGARKWGFRGTAEWLAWACGIGSRAARDHVRVARALRERPLTASAFAEGELSYSKVRALTRASPSEDERELLYTARRSTACALERYVAKLRSAPSSDAERANLVYEKRHVHWNWEVDGSLRVRASLPPEDGTALIEAIEAASDAMHGGGGSQALGTWLPSACRRADALSEIVISGAPRAHVVLHVDPAALACTATHAHERQGEVCAFECGPAVPSDTAPRLGCDAKVVSLLQDAEIDLGRNARVVNPALRGSLERRDQHCRFPGCSRRHGTQAHHLVHWIHGGETDRDNLVLLCRFHHRLVHEGGFSITRRGNDFAVRRPDGRVVPEIPAPVRAAPSPRPRPFAAAPARAV